MASALTAAWHIRRSCASEIATFSVHCDDKVVASEIGCLAHAEMIAAAPEAMEFAIAITSLFHGGIMADRLAESPHSLFYFCNTTAFSRLRYLFELDKLARIRAELGRA